MSHDILHLVARDPEFLVQCLQESPFLFHVRTNPRSNLLNDGHLVGQCVDLLIVVLVHLLLDESVVPSLLVVVVVLLPVVELLRLVVLLPLLPLLALAVKCSL